MHLQEGADTGMGASVGAVAVAGGKSGGALPVDPRTPGAEPSGRKADRKPAREGRGNGSEIDANANANANSGTVAV